ncbi:helix-turn-helix domain-containing protein [Sulfitobacter pseudonitzschiae]|uniref:Helix-turn-helix domain-containing protein n=1 Tax=Pseudosulfitobacter pseudonitzschiae TaxID=1402135 RepID=A0A9Q2NLA7_9RHOB|nr:helix-turn-helix domain-containing protein [Pseudosulfitobacter pseudonitzschiae]MBM2290967.1 helix-turn-helix domain-containing protein [Pseudosulfitobacter pseudonitzschiae]MBM2295885.1 helix-turn-helix domain-containing protein [Pseudosulfitobacter pseudonitzschiae]MBM2300798.1 helix-turn-helix domain-containing protein [Pseudosulfitobacter pseudonitzschiae]MBM2310582.1 helix-turn-helix domain-containing protein [Pseudosulfitobacter pseudonitzschiae]MBM2315495.1 helix-turn-helix domain-c
MTVDLLTRPKCSECPIRHRAVCSRCDADEIEQLEQIKSYKTFAAGDPILWRGDDLTYVASVVKGVATLSKTMEDGRIQMVGLLMPSDFIGRPNRKTIEFDVVAATEVTLCCFQRVPFERLLATVPHVAQRLLEIAMDELDAARDWMLLLGRKTAREKIATFVEMMVRRQHVDGLGLDHEPLVLPLTRDEISNYLGLTLETVSRQLNALKRDGVLRFVDRRRFEVIDMAALHAASGDDSDGGVLC